MANNSFSSIGGFFKSRTAPDSPEGKIYNLEKEMNGLSAQQERVYVTIGKLAAQKYGYDQFGDAGAELSRIDKLLEEKNQELQMLKEEIEKRRAEAAAAKAAAANAGKAMLVCSACGSQNPEGYRFCQECGAKLEAPVKTFCSACGAELVPGARFCGVCGAKQEAKE